jgi:hypothetical protein
MRNMSTSKAFEDAFEVSKILLTVMVKRGYWRGCRLRLEVHL